MRGFTSPTLVQMPLNVTRCPMSAARMLRIFCVACFAPGWKNTRNLLLKISGSCCATTPVSSVCEPACSLCDKRNTSFSRFALLLEKRKRDGPVASKRRKSLPRERLSCAPGSIRPQHPQTTRRIAACWIELEPRNRSACPPWSRTPPDLPDLCLVCVVAYRRSPATWTRTSWFHRLNFGSF